MLHRTLMRALIGVTAFTLPMAATPAAIASDIPVQAQQVTLYYDDSQAAEFKDDVAAGAKEWNANVENVRLEPASGGRAEIVVIADNGWPRAELGPVRPGGQVRIWFGRQAVNDGYDTIRIAAHEIGHSLGLPDIKPGPCSSLMSGSTAGVDCTNPTPNAEERAMAEDNYGTGAQGRKPASGEIVVDEP